MADKRLRVMLVTLREIKAYFVDFLFYLAGFPVFIAITYLFWRAMLQNATVAGMTLGYLMTYYATVYAVNAMTLQRGVANKISEDIVRGRIAVSLVKPMSYFSYNLWKRVANFSLYIVLYLGVLLAVSSAFKMQFTSDPLMIILFLASLVFSFLMNFAMFFCVGLTALWLEDNWGLVNAFVAFTSLFSGMLIPLELLSGTLRDVAFFLPFHFTAYFQASIIMGKMAMSDVITNFALMIAWTVIFLVIAKIAWRVGEKRITGYGV
ncbi:ABC-2 family transporter protein [Candidatus Micrarchaeota archaeon]|nr:ABC-2 family transporter protein [Candidatus Micrarchaeota archaeon]